MTSPDQSLLKEKRPIKIGTWMRESDIPFFSPLFSAEKGVQLIDARTQAVDLDKIDALLLTGGGDISPSFLQQPVENPLLLDSINESRDAWEFPATQKSLTRGIPILAICRGLQVLNVALGGTLHLDISGHNLPEQKSSECQPLRFAKETTFQFPLVNSSHHQAINKLGEGLQIEAWHRSDDMIEQARLKNYPFAFGTQFHPERGSIYQPLFNRFIDEIGHS